MGPGISPKLSASDKQYLNLSSLRDRRKESSTLASNLKKSEVGFCASFHCAKTTQHNESERMCRYQKPVTERRK